MKRLAILSATALIALPLLAGQSKPVPSQTAAQPSATVPTQSAAEQTPAAATTAAKPAPAVVSDSPLVAAAKRSTAKKKKSSFVITNDTLGGKNAKVTTTAKQEPLKLGAPSEAPPNPNDLTASLAGNQKKNAAAAAQKEAQDLEAAKLKRMQALRAQLEDDSLAVGADPAQVEHQLEQTSTIGQKQTPPPPKKP